MTPPPPTESSPGPQTAAVLRHLARAGAGPIDLVGSHGGAPGLILAQLRAGLHRPLVVVVPDEPAAHIVADGTSFFLGRSRGLGGRGTDDPVTVFPLLDHVPFQGMSPSRPQVMERVGTLFRIRHGLGVDVLVVPAAALLDRVIPHEALDRQARELRVGGTVDRDALIAFLAESGYHRVPAVEDPGSFSVRGGILDVFSPTGEAPIRIELWGDEIESMRTFDPTTQRTEDTVSSLSLGPARELIFSPEGIARARAAIFALADREDVPTSRVRALVDDLESGVLAVGMEDLLPLFHERLDSLFDAAWQGAVWLTLEPGRCEEAIAARSADLEARAQRRREARGELSLDAPALFLGADEAIAKLRELTRARLMPFAVHEPGEGAPTVVFEVEDNGDVRRDIEVALREGDEHVLASLARRVAAWRAEGRVVAACAHGHGGMERLYGLLRHYGMKTRRHEEPFSLAALPALAADRSAQLHLFEGTPGQGFRDPDLGLVLLDETEILGKPPRSRRRRRQAPPEQALQSWRDLAIGDFIVHLTHGIGRYRGLVKGVAGGIEADFILLEYGGGDKLYVPIEKLHLVSKHSAGDTAGVTVDKLGGTKWVKTHTRVRKAVRDIADKLVRLYAERASAPGHAFPAPDELFHQFVTRFPYEETPDQARAIDGTLADMQREHPMDRLVCGDVGFGKTEVALRAAFLAVLGGRQVAVLVPTQVLAEQHRLTFTRRLEGFPVTVESLSGMRTGRAQGDVLRRLASGGVDVVIGTHRLLSKDVAFKDLGLIVIDEEHRFGVAHKERLKEYRASVDVLTLTATPIPRTLHMAMMGLRDVSLIQTPPVDRLPIRTLVAQPNEDVISEAIRRELGRGGQVYFVHNRVEDIGKYAELIRRLVPEARVAVGHGQMAQGALEGVMMRFIRGEANVLVCTTIIESGIDIPNANTMLINRADRFGLAQLYQLRGRIGRSSARASCYLLVPAPHNLDGDAKARIAAIQRFSELGSGYSVATHDLDIRGAGDLLGADQSGNIDAVGYEAYMELLRQAIDDLRAEESGRASTSGLEPELKIAIEGRIPESWLPDETLRLRLYRDLAGATTVPGLMELVEAAVDRYGRAPTPVENLVDLLAVKLEARALGLRGVVYTPSELSLQLTELSPLPPANVAALLSAPGGRFKATPDLRLSRPVTAAEWGAGLETLRESLRWLANFATGNPLGRAVGS